MSPSGKRWRRHGANCWVLRRMEARGEIRGGRFVAAFIGEQFALPEALDLMRAIRRSGETAIESAVFTGLGAVAWTVTPSPEGGVTHVKSIYVLYFSIVRGLYAPVKLQFVPMERARPSRSGNSVAYVMFMR